MAKLTAIEGIGVTAERRLKAAGIGSTEALLKACCTRRSRREIASRTALDEKKLLRFVSHADLMRIKGVGGEYAELLEASGVDSVPELKQRNAANLREAMVAANSAKRRRLVRQLPSEEMVTGWVKQAKRLGRKVVR